jgi:predicted flap endonuclease-1-like 5' DNA nuclease
MEWHFEPNHFDSTQQHPFFFNNKNSGKHHSISEIKKFSDMRNSTSGAQEEALKSAYQDAKKAKKKAKAAFKAKAKELKAKLKPAKQALKEAEKAEKLAKAAWKALSENNDAATTETKTSKPAPTAEPTAPKRRGRQPGYSPKAAKAAAIDAPATAKPKAAASKGSDDLTQVKGVGENIAVMLRANGIKSFADMAATSFDRYKELLKANGMSKFRDPSQWAARAAELANLPAPTPAAAKPAAAEPTEKKKRGRQPGYSPKAAKAAAADAAVATAPKSKAAKAEAPKPEAPKVKGKPGRKPAEKPTATHGNDDLTQVKGVGENIAVMLRANGIKSFADMAATSFDRYKELLKANGMSKFRDPSQWAARAAELANLPAPAPTAAKPAAEPTEKKKRGRQPGYSPKAAKAAATGAAVAEAPKAKGKPGRKAVEKPAAAEPTEKKKRGRQPGYSPKAAKAAAAGIAVVEAPKVKGKPGRKAAEKPAAAEPTEKKKRGRQPGYSPKAAKAAAAGTAAPAKAAAPKAPAKPKGPPAKPDDLTQVKGVGSRVAEALNKEGIWTYKDMATVSLDRYKEILKENNMSKFRDPSDWAKIATELAGKK